MNAAYEEKSETKIDWEIREDKWTGKRKRTSDEISPIKENKIVYKKRCFTDNEQIFKSGTNNSHKIIPLNNPENKKILDRIFENAKNKKSSSNKAVLELNFS